MADSDPLFATITTALAGLIEQHAMTALHQQLAAGLEADTEAAVEDARIAVAQELERLAAVLRTSKLRPADAR